MRIWVGWEDVVSSGGGWVGGGVDPHAVWMVGLGCFFCMVLWRWGVGEWWGGWWRREGNWMDGKDWVGTREDVGVCCVVWMDVWCEG